jgi:hypothetical protein
MDDAILPLHSAPKAQVLEYLGRRGLSRDVIEWKYYDEQFNRGRTRGYVWMVRDQVQGFIGLIPWSVRRRDEQLDMVWGCDWSVADPHVSKGMGLTLAAHSMSLHRPWLSLGGSKKARLIMPHLCHHRVEEAGLVYWQPLRVGASSQLVKQVSRWPRWLGRACLNQVPIRWVQPPSSRNPDVVTEPGLSPDVARLIEHNYESEWHPHHRHDDLSWSLERCPSIAVRTCSIRGLSGPDAAAVVWRSTQATDFWKVALWAAPLRQSLIPALLQEVRWQVYQEGGVAISTLVSHLQADLIEQLQTSGYWRQPGSLPMYLVGEGKQSLPFHDMTGLSYLCTDLAHRF